MSRAVRSSPARRVAGDRRRSGCRRRRPAPGDEAAAAAASAELARRAVRRTSADKPGRRGVRPVAGHHRSAADLRRGRQRLGVADVAGRRRNIRKLADAFAGRIVITRWVPPDADARVGSWRAYMAAWPFADAPPTIASSRSCPSWRTFTDTSSASPRSASGAKNWRCGWGTIRVRALRGVDGLLRHLDRPARRGRRRDDHRRHGRLRRIDAREPRGGDQVLGLYPPQITLRTTDEVLGG